MYEQLAESHDTWEVLDVKSIFLFWSN